jgi:hypothetical protein
METVSITKNFVTFAEAATWADDEIAEYLADGYECSYLCVSKYESGMEQNVIFSVSITVEKGE